MKALRTGDVAPTFVLEEPGGGRFALDEQRGRLVVLLFLRSRYWPFCRRHLVEVQQRLAEFQRAGAVVVGIAPHEVRDARALAAELGVRFPLLADPGRRVFEAFGVGSRAMSLGQRPGAFVVDAGGRLAFAHVGAQQWNVVPPGRLLGVVTRLAETAA